jgi:hypothetical protein
MKIYRGARTGRYLNRTDEAATEELEDWTKKWRPGQILQLDGTIDKGGGRHTKFGVEIEPQDIVALNDALVRYHQTRIGELEARISELEKGNAELSEAGREARTGLRKIFTLTDSRRTRAPSPDELLDELKKIAGHFMLGSGGVTDPPHLSAWIKWKDLY